MTVAQPLDPGAFPVTRDWTYLNTVSMGPIPQRAVEEMHRAAIDAAVDASLSFDAQMIRAEEVRARVARLMGVATAEDVAFVANTTTGTSIVAGGLDLRAGDRVVVTGAEFPSTIFPWLGLRERGVIVDTVATPEGFAGPSLAAFAEVIDAGPPPAVVATSWVNFVTGWRHDLAALADLAHAAGAFFVVDAIQGLGVVPADFGAWGVDAASADGHKWLLGPNGAAVVYLAPQLRERLRAVQPGWLSAPAETAYALTPEWYADARRFAGGTPNIVGIHGLGAGVDLLVDAGVDAIWRHVDALAAGLVTALGERGLHVVSDRDHGASSIVSFTSPDRAADDVVAELAKHRVVVSARNGHVRVGIHGFNSDADIATLLDALCA